MNASNCLDYRHTPGGSCACVAWSGVYKKHGHDFKESDIFGLGGGIFFGYCAIGRTKFFDICLTSSNLVEDLLINTGVHGKLMQYADGYKGLDEIIGSIDRGYPVAVQLNPYGCEGLIRVTPEDLRKHLPAHWVVVTGYDPISKELRIFDNRQFSPIVMSYKDFLCARNSGIDDQNPKNFYYNVFFFKQLYPIEQSIKMSLKKVHLNFFEVQKILSFYTGSYGLEKFSRQIAIWNKMMNEDDLVSLLKKITASMTGAGGIKGGYRALYASYLKDASAMLNDDSLLDASFGFKESAIKWNSLVAELMAASANPKEDRFWGKTSTLSHLLHGIHENEMKGFEILGKIIKK